MRKTHIAKFLGAAMALTMAFTGCASNGTSSTASDSAADGSAAEGAKRIGVIQYASHPSLDNCYEGVRQGLVEAYGEDGVIIDLQNGQGDGAACDSISANFVSKGYDMIYAIATPAALSAYSAANKSDIPVIFCAGDPRIREKMDLDVQVAKLKVLRGDFQNQKYRLEDKLLKTFPEEIQKQKTRIAALQQDSQIAAAHPQDKENFCGMTIKGMVYDDKKAAGERLLLARQEMPNADMMLLGTYRGFELNIRFDSFKNEHQAVLRAELSYPVSLGDDARGNITRLDNAIDNFADRIADAENALQNLEQQKQAAEVEVAKPFAQEEELAEKSARLAELNALLNIDRDRSSSQDAPEETEETETPATRPSVLAALGEKPHQPEPVKPFRSYYDKDGDAR